MTVQAPKNHFLDLPFPVLQERFATQKIPLYRLEQIYDWIFNRHQFDFAAMTNLPQHTRQNLQQSYVLRKLTIDKTEKSNLDPTEKFHFKTEQNQSMSAVFLPHIGYQTLCISSQVGCAWACSFCASGLVKFERNLSPGEILDQIFCVEEATQKKVHNILFMGMGEPLANYNNVVQALTHLTHKKSLAISPDRITVSTTGLAPQIEMLAQLRLNIHLALSLHAPNDSLRKKIMPISARFSIAQVLSACKKFQEQNKSDFTVEYILLDRVNDQVQHAKELAQVLKSFGFRYLPKINLIPNNPVEGIVYGRPSPEAIENFYKTLKAQSFIVHTRKAQGQDIAAACGQLS